MNMNPDEQQGTHSNSYPDSGLNDDSDKLGGSSNELGDGGKKGKKRRRFTNEEDNKIMEGVQKFYDKGKGGVDWEKMVKWAGINRTKDQVRSRYTRCLSKPAGSAQTPNTPSKNSPGPLLGQGTDYNQFHFHSSSFAPSVGTPQSPVSAREPSDFDIQSAIELEEMQPYQKKQKTINDYIGKKEYREQPTINLHSLPSRVHHVQSTGTPTNINNGANGITVQVPSTYTQSPSTPSSRSIPQHMNIMAPSSNSNSSSSMSGFADYQQQPARSPPSPNSFTKMMSQNTQTEVTGDFLRSLRREIEEKNGQINDLEIKRRELEERSTQLQNTIHDQQSKEIERNEKFRLSLVELLKERAERERREDKRIVDENTIRIGTITYQKAVDVYEIWQDGEQFIDLERRANKIVEEREKIEKLKKGVQKERQNMKKESNMTEKQMHDKMDYFNEMEEIYKIRLSTLKKEEANLNVERDRMQIEKSIQIREIKRIRDQERSRFNNMPILKDRYLLIKMLGRGGFSEVYKAYDLQDLRIVACKIHQLNPNWKEHRKENYIKHVLRECQIHKSVNHPRLIQMFDTFIFDNNTFVTVLEYCNGYDLDLYIKKHQKIPEKEAKSIMMQVFSGLKYMNEQKQKIIHFDLKPANILFLDDGQIKITDFGLSKIMEEEDAIELTSQGAGTYWYLPPECFEMGRVPKISPKVDVWSAGVVFYQMLYGKKPFGNDLSQQKILSERTIVNATTVAFPSKPQVSEEAKNFIRKCLTHDKDQRPDVWTLYNDPYLRGGKAGKQSSGPSVPMGAPPPPSMSAIMNLNHASTSSDGDFMT